LHDDRRAARGQPSTRGHERQAVEIRHHAIEQHGVDLVAGFEIAEARARVFERRDAESRGIQILSDQRETERVVVDGEDLVARGHDATCDRGYSTNMLVPPCALWPAQIRPPWLLAICRQMGRPNPVEPGLPRSRVLWTKLSNTVSS
jgi:hypothetical protein